jgi:hypothetical protein
MSLLELTSFAQIRGVLTVSSADLPDATLAGYGLEDDLQVELESWLANWQAITSGADEQRKRLLRLWAKYYCAAVVASTASVFVLKKVSDGANEGQRSDTEGFAHIKQEMLDKAAGFKRQLEKLINPLVVTDTMTFTSRVIPGRDPITQARS